MKKSFILLAVLFAACNKEDCFNDSDNQYVLLKVKNYEYIVSGDIQNLKVNCDNYGSISVLDSLKVKKLKKILESKDYQIDHDFASCPVDFCIIRVDDGKVEDKIFLGCQGNMIYVLRREVNKK